MTKAKLQICIVLLALGLLTRFLFIWYPAEVVFDEVHFGKFVSAYFDGKYYFDIHPPLGKLLIAGFAKFFGFRPGFDFENIGEGYGDIPYMALRFLPNFFGALIPLALFLWLGAMGVSRMAAGFAAFLILFDNAMLAQSHFILVDSMLLFFGLCGLWLFFRARNRGYRMRDIALAGAVLGLSFSVKWTGLAFFGLAMAVMLWDVWRSRRFSSVSPFARPAAAKNRLLPAASLLKTPRALVLFVCCALLVYAAVFWVHFALLPNPGQGNAFMSAQFTKKSFLGKFVELNGVMFSSNAGLAAGHPYGSPAWTWPLMLRPVYFWVRDFSDGGSGRIYLLGNPAVWWLTTIGLLAAIFVWKPRTREKKWILYVGYLAETLPFLGVTRVTFLYHYLGALAFAAAITAGMLFDEGIIPSRDRGRVLMMLGAVAIAGFFFFAPLSYGWPLGDFWYKMRVWLPSWI